MPSFVPISPATWSVRWSSHLYVAGTLPGAPRVAVVGSRATRARYTRCIQPIVQGIADAGGALVSGGAIGVDAVAHRAALELGVPQVAVLPGPPDALYPPDHEPLFAAIVEAGGAVVCPHPPGTVMARGMFASRNAIVVQLVARVVVVQAALRSGTRVTLEAAFRRGRPVAGVSGSPGVAWAMERGACSLGGPDESSASMRDRARRFVSAQARARPGALPWPPHLQAVEAAFADRAVVTLDDLADPLAAAVALVEAEALGLVCESGPGRYVRADR